MKSINKFYLIVITLILAGLGYNICFGAAVKNVSAREKLKQEFIRKYVHDEKNNDKAIKGAINELTDNSYLGTTFAAYHCTEFKTKIIPYLMRILFDDTVEYMNSVRYLTVWILVRTRSSDVIAPIKDMYSIEKEDDVKDIESLAIKYLENKYYQSKKYITLLLQDYEMFPKPVMEEGKQVLLKIGTRIEILETHVPSLTKEEDARCGDQTYIKIRVIKSGKIGYLGTPADSFPIYF